MSIDDFFSFAIILNMLVIRTSSLAIFFKLNLIVPKSDPSR